MRELTYIVTIEQIINYTEKLVLKFNDLSMMEIFIRTVLNHAENVSCHITIDKGELDNE